jgi:hypothetical protein
MFTWFLLSLHVSILVAHHQVIVSVHLNKNYMNKHLYCYLTHCCVDGQKFVHYTQYTIGCKA